MAAAILDIEVDQLPHEVTGLSSYGHALALLRVRGRPVGQVSIPIIQGRISGEALRAAVTDSVGWPIWQRCLHDFLGWDENKVTDFISPPATVAICTRDRPDDLRRCIDGLMCLPDDGQELLVVDNCPSTDATRKIADSYARVRYVREDCPGLNVARNRALREARNEVVTFIDDDASPDKEWLRALLRNFEDPLVYCVTGLTMPLELETDAQEWHERWSSFGRGFQRRAFEGFYFNPMAAGQIGSGVNMALRHSVLDKLGPFDEALDAGTPTRSGGDSEMFSRILGSGYRIVYDPQALNWHRHRRTWKELRRMIFGYGVGVYAAWTSRMVSCPEIGVVSPAMGWLLRKQLPALARCLILWPWNAPLDLAVAELCGCVAGPWIYFSSRRQSRKKGGADGS